MNSVSQGKRKAGDAMTDGKTLGAPAAKTRKPQLSVPQRGVDDVQEEEQLTFTGESLNKVIELIQSSTAILNAIWTGGSPNADESLSSIQIPTRPSQTTLMDQKIDETHHRIDDQKHIILPFLEFWCKTLLMRVVSPQFPEGASSTVFTASQFSALLSWTMPLPTFSSASGLVDYERRGLIPESLAQLLLAFGLVHGPTQSLMFTGEKAPFGLLHHLLIHCSPSFAVNLCLFFQRRDIQAIQSLLQQGMALPSATVYMRPNIIMNCHTHISKHFDLIVVQFFWHHQWSSAFPAHLIMQMVEGGWLNHASLLKWLMFTLKSPTKGISWTHSHLLLLEYLIKNEGGVLEEFELIKLFAPTNIGTGASIPGKTYACLYILLMQDAKHRSNYSPNLLDVIPYMQIIDALRIQKEALSTVYPKLVSLICKHRPWVMESSYLSPSIESHKKDMVSPKRRRQGLNRNAFNGRLYDIHTPQALKFILGQDLLRIQKDDMHAVVGNCIARILNGSFPEESRALFVSTWEVLHNFCPEILWTLSIQEMSKPLISSNLAVDLKTVFDQPCGLFTLPREAWHDLTLLQLLLKILRGILTAKLHKIDEQCQTTYASFSKAQVQQWKHSLLLNVIQHLVDLISFLDNSPPQQASSIQSMICLYLHELFLQHPILVHQLYPILRKHVELVPLLLSRVESLHILFDALPEWVSGRTRIQDIVFGAGVAVAYLSQYPLERGFHFASHHLLPAIKNMLLAAYVRPVSGGEDIARLESVLVKLIDVFPGMSTDIVTMLDDIYLPNKHISSVVKNTIDNIKHKTA